MSMSTLTKIATQRESGRPQTTKREEPRGGSKGQTDDRSYLSTLAAAIPTEPLALYTFVTATILSTIEPGSDQRLLMRWVIYAATIVVIVLWLAGSFYRNLEKKAKKRKFPWVETASAAVAFAAWGLAMPESPLNAELSSNNRTIWTAIIVAVAILLLGMFGKPMKEPAKRRGAPGAPAKHDHEVTPPVISQ